MAKKKETKVEVETPQVEETVVVEEPKVETTKVKTKPQEEKKVKSKDNWEIKDRVYYLTGKKRPLSHSIRSSNLFWFDEEKGLSLIHI